MQLQLQLIRLILSRESRESIPAPPPPDMCTPTHFVPPHTPDHPLLIKFSPPPTRAASPRLQPASRRFDRICMT